MYNWHSQVWEQTQLILVKYTTQPPAFGSRSTIQQTWVSRAFCGHLAGCLQSQSVHQFSQQSVHHTWSPEQQGVPRNQMGAFPGELGHSTEAREGEGGRRQVMSSWLVSQVSVTSPASPPPPCSPTSSNSTSLIQCQPLSGVFHQAHNWQQGGELLHD